MKRLMLIPLLSSIIYSANAQTERNHDAFFEDFNDAASKYFRYGSTGNKADFKYKMGVNSTAEHGKKILQFKLDPADSAGAGKGPEIISNYFTHFGSYSARLKVPAVKSIQPNAGAVVGYFTYHVDSVPGLSEIDFEWLIADPSIIYIGTWTGKNGELKRIGRTLNLAKGIIYNTVYKEGYKGIATQLTGMQNQPETIPLIENYDGSSKFYTYGFDWYPDRIRWWMIHPGTGEKITLWDYQGSQVGIPQNHTHYRMNFWRTKDWSVEGNPNSIEKPLYPFELEVDWMRYDPI